MESHCVVFISLVLVLIQSVRPGAIRRRVNGETDHGPGWEEWILECQLLLWASLVAQSAKNLPAMQENWVRFLGWEGPLEKETEPTLAWRVPLLREAGCSNTLEKQEIDQQFDSQSAEMECV